MNTRDKIIYFGKQEFLEHGYSNASLRSIAAAAEMTTGAIYTYFADKNKLFEAATDSAYHIIHALMDNMIKQYMDDGGNAHQGPNLYMRLLI